MPFESTGAESDTHVLREAGTAYTDAVQTIVRELTRAQVILDYTI